MFEDEQKVIHVDKSTENRMSWENNKTIQNVIRNMASAGLSDKDIAGLIGVRLSTLRNRVRSVPEIEESLLEGRSHATQIMVSKMFETAIGGNITQEITERVNAKGGKSVTVLTKEAPPNAPLMMYWLNNCDPENWKPQRQLVVEAKGSINNVQTAESDKIARLSREVFESDTDWSEREHTVSEEAAYSTGEESLDEGDLQADVQGETADYIQDDVVDIPAEEGTEPL